MQEESMIRGDTLNIETDLKDKNGTAIATNDISTIFCTLRKNPNSIIIFQKKFADMTYSSGKLKIKFNPEDTQQLECGKYVFDIEVTLTNGLRKSKIVSLEITEDITRHEASI